MSLLLLLRSPAVTPPVTPVLPSQIPVPTVEIDFQGNPSATYSDIQTTQDSGLAFWRMNSASTFLDTRGAHNGTIIGTPTTTASPYAYDSDLALAFDGSTDGAYVPSASDLTNKGPMTIEGWLRVDSLPAANRDVVAKRGAWLLQVTSAGKLVWTLKDDNSTATVTTNTALTAATWYHVAAVYDSVNIYVYVNGVLDNQTAYTAGWEGWTQPIRFAVTPSASGPTYQSQQAGSTNGAGAVTASLPASTANGDLLLAHVAAAPGGAGDVSATPPSGWTPLSSLSCGTVGTLQHVRTWLYYKIAASEPASYTWNFSGGTSGSAHVIRITGQDSLAPIANIAYGTSDAQSFGTTHTAGSHIPNVNNSLVLAFCDAGWNGGASSFTWSSGTEAYDVGSASSGSSMSYQSQATAASISVTATSSAPNGGALAANNILLFISGSGYSYATVSMKDWSFSNVARSAQEIARDYAARSSGTGTWTDVSSRLRSFDAKGASRQYELDQMEAGTASLLLKDTTRAFDPANTSSPYYPGVIPERKIRGRTTYQGIVYDLFYAYVERWPTEDIVPGYQEITLKATDGFDALALADVSGTLDAGFAGAQINKLLDKALWPRSARAIDAGQYVMTGQTLNGKALGTIQEIADSERGIFFIDLDGTATFHDSAHRGSFSRSTTAQVLFVDEHVADQPSGQPWGSSGWGDSWGIGVTLVPHVFYQDYAPSYDRDHVINDWTVSPDSSIFQSASQTQEDADSIARYWRRSQSRSTRLASNADALTQAGNLLNETAQPGLRYDTLTVIPTTVAAYQACLGLRIADRVSVTRGLTQKWTGSLITRDCFIEARDIQASMSDPWVFTFSLSPVSLGNYRATIIRDGPVSYWRMDTQA